MTTIFRPALLFVGGQVILGLSLAVCVALVPHYFFSRNQGGISNFGTEMQTTALFAIGFGAATLGSAAAALALPKSVVKRTPLRASLSGLALLYLLVLLSTFSYKVNAQFDRLHVQAAIALFFGMLSIATWLRFAAVKDRPMQWAYAIFVGGFVAAILTFTGIIYILFTVQIICGLAFGYLLTHALRKFTVLP